MIFYSPQIKYLESSLIHALDIPLKSNLEHIMRLPLKSMLEVLTDKIHQNKDSNIS